MKTDIKIPLLYFCILAFLFLPYFVLCFYIWPSGDDYSYAVKGRDCANFIEAVLAEWYQWNGRYMSNFLVFSNPIAWNNFSLYRLCPALLVLASVGTNFFLFKKFIVSSNRIAILISLLFSLLYLCMMPDVGEGIYWYTASVTYFAPLLLLPLYLYSLATWLSTSKMKGLLMWINILLQFVLTGFNEILMLYLLLFTTVLFFLKFKQKPHIAILFIAQLVFSFIVLIAPGNEVRSAFFQEKHHFFHTLSNGFANTARYLYEWVISPVFVTAALLLARLVPPKKALAAFPWWIWALFTVIPVFVACAAPVWTTGIIGQQRTVNFSLYFLLFFCLLFWVNEQGTAIHQFLIGTSSKISLNLLFILFVVSIVFWKNEKNAFEDLLTGKA